MPLEIHQKTVTNVKSPKGEINFRTSPDEFAPTDYRQTSLSDASGVHTKYLWWLTFVFV